MSVSGCLRIDYDRKPSFASMQGSVCRRAAIGRRHLVLETILHEHQQGIVRMMGKLTFIVLKNGDLFVECFAGCFVWVSDRG